ncbi:tubulin-specific chaperone C [Cololabis saira]|uniref:tubulin-specific chaperone C n=1 Tax=Cololabis saira TaxID=129043 RepID=UPI002AD224DD|nr:tubulin-specific chaperone C [Cololabis saira]XP_061564850.1 tubulin-specific chaperone C [Cololabis saira]
MDHPAETSQENEFNGKIQERLHKRNQARVEDAERKKESQQSQSLAEEKSSYFSSSFYEQRDSVQQLLSSCAGADRAAATLRLEEATAQILLMQKFLNDSMPFLTSFHLTKAQAALQKLQASLAETREEALPKKKFAFRARSKAAEPVPAPAPAPEADRTPPDAASPADPGTTGVDGAPPSDLHGFSHRKDEFLSMTAEEILHRDLLLTHLTNCKVRLYGSPSTLHLKHIDSCEILCGPVSTSVFIDHCKDSTLAFPCQQLRTHNTTDTQVYLHVTSRAIIEYCRGMSFAPFSWSYPTLQDDFSASGLDQGRNNWNQVDDFNWLAAGTPSPNWTVIPEMERKTTWDP